MTQVTIVESRSEIGAGTRGASLGVDAVKIASLRSGSSFFIDRATVEIINNNEIIYKSKSETDDYAKNIEGLIELYEDFSKKLNQIYGAGEFPIILAGDHSSAAGTITGIKNTYPEKRLGVIWIDAHADLHSPFTTPTGNVHGMPLAVCLNEDNKELQKNNVSDHTRSNWEKLKSIGGIAPKIKPEDLVLIAVRDTEKEEEHLIKKLLIKDISVEKLKAIGSKQVAKEALNHLEECDIIYITFDVDSMDCNLVSHGTGTPVPNGLSEEEATILLHELVKSPKLCCLEVTEVNPTLDEKTNTMADTAFRILESVTETIEQKLNNLIN